jgi:hypothetical protein
LSNKFIQATSSDQRQKMHKIVYELSKLPNAGPEWDTAFDMWFALTKTKGLVRDAKPKLIREKVHCPFKIENVTENIFDGTSEWFKMNESDPIFLALYPTLDPSICLGDIKHGQMFSSRKVFRKLSNVFLTPYLPSKVNDNRFFTAVKDFSIFVENINSLIILQFSERWSDTPGGYGMGLSNELTKNPAATNLKPSAIPEVHQCDYASYYRMNALQIGSISLLVRNEVDAIDENDNSVEIKATKFNERFGLSTEYFLNLWIQNLFGKTTQSRIGLHDGKGTVIRILSLDMNEIQHKAEIDSNVKRQLFEHLESFLSWVRTETPTNCQAIISYDAKRNSFEMQVIDDHRYPIISSGIRNLLKEVSF